MEYMHTRQVAIKSRTAISSLYAIMHTIELQVICPPLEFVDKFVESLQIYKKSAAGEIFGKL